MQLAAIALSYGNTGAPPKQFEVSPKKKIKGFLVRIRKDQDDLRLNTTYTVVVHMFYGKRSEIDYCIGLLVSTMSNQSSNLIMSSIV